MNTDRQPHHELRELLAAMEEGSITAAGIDRIDELVRSDERLLRQYIEYTRLVSDLRYGVTAGCEHDVLAQLIDMNREAATREPGAAAGMPANAPRGMINEGRNAGLASRARPL